MQARRSWQHSYSGNHDEKPPFNTGQRSLLWETKYFAVACMNVAFSPQFFFLFFFLLLVQQPALSGEAIAGLPGPGHDGALAGHELSAGAVGTNAAVSGRLVLLRGTTTRKEKKQERKSKEKNEWKMNEWKRKDVDDRASCFSSQVFFFVFGSLSASSFIFYFFFFSCLDLSASHSLLFAPSLIVWCLPSFLPFFLPSFLSFFL